MNKIKSGGKIYGRSCIFVGTLVLCYDLGKPNISNLKSESWEILKDLSLVLIWPIVTPSTLIRVLKNMEFGPFDDWFIKIKYSKQNKFNYFKIK